MSAKVLDGQALARRLEEGLAPRVAALRRRLGRPPSLAALSAGAGAGAESYLQAQLKACREAGLRAESRSLPAKTTERELLSAMRDLAADDSVDAVLLAVPLPRHVDTDAVRAALPQAKDVEGVTAEHFGRLFLAKSRREIDEKGLVVPPTALAVVECLRESGLGLCGRRAVVVGRSSVAGRPIAHLLSCLDATVTLCHSRSKDLEEEVRRAEVVVACAGLKDVVRGAWIREAAVVADAGINPTPEGLRGDVEFAPAAESASFITPVPGGVGPVTTAMLLSNAVLLAEKRAG